MRRSLWETFFGRGDDEEEYEHADDEPIRSAQSAAPAAPLSLEPPLIPRRDTDPDEETPAPSAGSLDLPPIATASMPAPPAASDTLPTSVPLSEPEPLIAPPPSSVRALSEWAGSEVVSLINELSPSARERVAEALLIWHETEALLAQSRRRSESVAETSERLLAGPLADPEFAHDTANLRAGTDQQRGALDALLEGNRARARDWVLSAVQGVRTWPPAKVIRLFDLAGIGALTLADLQPRLRSMDAAPRMWVAEALGLMTEPESGQTLLTLLRDPDADVRATAVAALGRKGDVSLLHALGTVIRRDPDWFVRLRAIQAAQGIEGYEAVGFLHDLLKDAGWWRELQVLDSMEKAGAPDGTHDKVRTGVVNSLLGKVQALLPGADPAHRAWLMEVLGDTRDARAVPLLSSAMHDADLEVRLRALRGLGHIGGPTIVDILIPALKDQQPQVRIQASEALGDANDFRALEPLLEAMRDEDDNVRAAAVSAIGKIWDRKALGPMMDALAALNDPDQKTRDEFQRAMQRMSDPRTMNLVMNMLEAGGMRTRRPGT